MRKIKASLRDNNVKFVVNKEKNTVVCLINTHVYYKIPGMPEFLGDYSKRFESMGKAVCSEQDVFSEKTGKQIAESRAKTSLYRQIRQFISKMRNRTANDLVDLDFQHARYTRLIETEKTHIKDLVK